MLVLILSPQFPQEVLVGTSGSVLQQLSEKTLKAQDEGTRLVGLDKQWIEMQENQKDEKTKRRSKHLEEQKGSKMAKKMVKMEDPTKDANICRDFPGYNGGSGTC